MDDLAEMQVGPGLLLAIAAVCLASSAVWGLMCIQLAQRKPLVPYEPRTRVPWQPVDMLVIVSSYFVFNIAVGFVAFSVLPVEWTKPLADGKMGAEHQILPLLRHGGTYGLLLAALMAVVVAPLVEEFLFRLVLQGGLETMLRRRRRVPRWLGAAVSILLPAILFALLHLRWPSPEYPWQYTVAMMISAVIGGLATLVFGVAWLRVRWKVTWEDLGFVPRKFVADARLGAFSLLAFIVPVYVVQGALLVALRHVETRFDWVMPAPDPLAIFLFAIVWGVLYRRTHRLVPSLVAHAMLNALSLGLAFGLFRGI